MLVSLIGEIVGAIDISPKIVIWESSDRSFVQRLSNDWFEVRVMDVAPVHVDSDHAGSTYKHQGDDRNLSHHKIIWKT